MRAIAAAGCQLPSDDKGSHGGVSGSGAGSEVDDTGDGASSSVAGGGGGESVTEAPISDGDGQLSTCSECDHDDWDDDMVCADDDAMACEGDIDGGTVFGPLSHHLPN